jgi:hypothetical protein
MAGIVRVKQSVARLVPNAGNDNMIVPNAPPLGAALHTYQYTNGASPTQTPAAGNATQATGSLFVRFNQLTIEGTDISAAVSWLKPGDTVTIGPQSGVLGGYPSRNGQVWALPFVTFPSLPDGIYAVSSSLGAAPGATVPACTVNPLATGQAKVGSTITCTTGRWKGTQPIAYTYQWKRNGVNIASATAATYLVDALDVGTLLQCEVTGTNGAGSGTALSNKLYPVA